MALVTANGASLWRLSQSLAKGFPEFTDSHLLAIALVCDPKTREQHEINM